MLVSGFEKCKDSSISFEFHNRRQMQLRKHEKKFQQRVLHVDLPYYQGNLVLFEMQQ